MLTTRMTWDDWLDVWHAHAGLDGFRRKVDAARQTAWEGYAKGRLYGSLSGGKDSVAVAGLLAESEIDIRWCHAHSVLNLPDTMGVVDAVADRLDLELDVVEPDEDPMWALRDVPPDVSVLDPGVLTKYLLDKFSAGVLLTRYSYSTAFDGHVDGRRADENKRTRGKLFASRGPVWRSEVDGLWSVSPLAWWSARDSFAFCVSRELPIHPFYRLALESAEMPADTAGIERARVDWLFGLWLRGDYRDDDVCRAVRRAYPERWAELVSIRPELGAIR